MRKLAATAFVLLLALVSVACLPGTARAPLASVPTNVGTLFPAQARGLTVVVHDTRADANILYRDASYSEAHLQWVLGTEKPGAVADAVGAAARQAAGALGFREGSDATLDILIKSFQVDAYRSTQYAPMNCLAYAEIETVVTAAGGAARRRTARLVYWEDTSSIQPYSITREAISRIYAQAAWEATYRALQEELPSRPDPAALSHALQTASGTGDDFSRREAIFWLGLAGQGDAAVAEGLLSLFRSAPQQEISAGAAEAIGMIGLTSATAEVEAVLAGSKKLANWDIEDTEAVWYLLKTLALLGVPDLERRIPRSPHLNNPEKLTDLIAFLGAGTIPKLSPAQQQDLEKARLKLQSP